MARGSQAANQAAKRAALQNHDLIGVATLVPQTNLPETPSLLKVRLLKLRVRLSRRSYRVAAKGGTPFSVWEPPMKVG